MAILAAHNKSKTELSERDEWRTPPELFEWLRNHIGFGVDFDIDLAATRENRLCERFFDDSLVMNWHRYGDVGFCNPPFSMKSEFIEKAKSESRKGFVTVMLLPFSPETEWWRNGMCERWPYRHILVPKYRQTILYPRVNYIGAGSGCPFVTCVVEFAKNKGALEHVEWATWK